MGTIQFKNTGGYGFRYFANPLASLPLWAQLALADMAFGLLKVTYILIQFALTAQKNSNNKNKTQYRFGAVAPPPEVQERLGLVCWCFVFVFVA